MSRSMKHRRDKQLSPPARQRTGFNDSVLRQFRPGPSPEMVIAPLTPNQIRAIQALDEGIANEDQQMMALAAIKSNFCMLHDVAYFGENPQASAFMAGRQYIGRLINEVLQTPTGDMADTTEKAP